MAGTSRSRFQFGIRGILLLTTVVAALLGIAMWIVQHLPESDSLRSAADMPTSWLRERVDSEDASADVTPVELGILRRSMKPGDELRKYAWHGGPKMGEGGYVIVRGGKPTKKLPTWNE